MRLKKYQSRLLEQFRQFLQTVTSLKIDKALRFAYIDHLGDDARAYRPLPDLDQVPYLCIKVPTGGGKTLIGTHAVQIIQDNYTQDKNGKGAALWFVPSDAIRTQTIAALSNKNHPYRAALDAMFGGAVHVLNVEDALSIQPSDLRDNLCIIVASLAAFRRTDPTWLKVFQDNGTLMSHFENIANQDGLNTDSDGNLIFSLANVLGMHNPIVILDEGHNAQTKLSFDMLASLNPSFVLELTATPRSTSNVLIDVPASELKNEHMVKIPIYLTNEPQWQEAIRAGVEERKKLEKLANAEKRETKEYLRPITLLQAEQVKESEKKIHVGQVREFLISDLKIPEEQLAIKTATQDEIAGVNLSSTKCPIRYIITVNALKEGWDCPFAYVLVSVANIGSTVAVEQTMGRILRLPSTKEKRKKKLNYSYVFASSETFTKASAAVIKGLESNGFSREDLREYKGGKVTPEKTEFVQVIKDVNIRVPMISEIGSKDPLAFSRDLLRDAFSLPKEFVPFNVDFHSDQARKVKIDVDKEAGIYRIVQGKLALTINPEDFSEEELLGWLKRNVRHTAVTSEEMGNYLVKALKHALKDHTLDELSINRFRLKERLQEVVLETIQGYTKKQFEDQLKKKKLETKSASFSPPKTTLLSRITDEKFSKHLFERAGHLNGEEIDFAFRIDALENVQWWFRNREKEDFYLQGWKAGKFYPDYIIKTKSGKCVVVEYKGADRLSNEDTGYKQALGRIWEELNPMTNHFFLASKSNADSVVKGILALDSGNKTAFKTTEKFTLSGAAAGKVKRKGRPVRRKSSDL